MSVPHSHQNVRVLHSPDDVKSEKIGLQLLHVNDQTAKVCTPLEFYAQVGAQRGGNVVDCLTASSAAHLNMEASHHELGRALLFIGWELTKRVVENDSEWKNISELSRWKHRHIKPTLNDDEGSRSHFIANFMFSNGSRRGDDLAAKKGRAVEYLIRKNRTEQEVLAQLVQPGGIDRIYKMAVTEYPRSARRRRSDGKTARPMRIVAVCRKSSNARRSLSDDQNIAQPIQLNALDSDPFDLIDPIVFAPGVNERAAFLEMNRGDKLLVMIECTERDGDRVELGASIIRPVCEAE
ncbi:hypothetical protein MKK69_25930 [Methylobacterium sp. J-026]|uniref:hypothetical protein n=1 Tax=Methylobacterium sp. J-026 TaxID=2836624 RepID=UPI001FBAA3CC|nr:hypothetical protein [Methylobacterium sp. J-026]MCJ2137440.1 hypothetical protein [Methylobacterium sp. J-026]